MTRRLITIVVSALAFAGTAGADTTIPQGGGAANVVNVVSTGVDGTTHERTQVQIAPIGGEDVQNSNVASALSFNCDGCHAGAVAVQVVLVFGSPSVFAPGNGASAVNAGCSNCASYAYAWQYLVQTPGPVFLSPTGRAEVAALEGQMRQALADGDPWTLAAALALTDELDGLTDQLKTVVNDELLAAGVPAQGSAVREVQQQPVD